MEDRLANDPARDDELILVDGLDCQLGCASKERVHELGMLHRAFSVALFRDGAHGPELLLARRAEGKYHSGGLWANSCCSHPRAGEELMDAAYRRVREELGTSAVGLREAGAFVYRAEFANGLCEYEYDHVLIGRCGGEPVPDPSEVAEIRWIDAKELAVEIAHAPGWFAAWAPAALAMAMAEITAS